MNKIEALNTFWNGFGLVAYDATSVPDDAVLPYITYESADSDFGNSVALTASLWYRDTSWRNITLKSMAIENHIGRGGIIVNYSGGAMWIRKGVPWSNRLSAENDDSVRRIVLNVEVEFID